MAGLPGMDVSFHLRELVSGRRRVMVKENDVGKRYFGGGWHHF